MGGGHAQPARRRAFWCGWSNIAALIASAAAMSPKPTTAPRLQAAYDGKTYQNPVPTTVSPPSGYAALC